MVYVDGSKSLTAFDAREKWQSWQEYACMTITPILRPDGDGVGIRPRPKNTGALRLTETQRILIFSFGELPPLTHKGGL